MTHGLIARRRPVRAALAARTVALCAAVLLPVVTASPAAAGTARLWACHGPDGAPLGGAGLAGASTLDGQAAAIDGGCDAVGGAVRATLGAGAPRGGSSASWRIDAPQGVLISQVRADRRVLGFGAAVDGGSQRYGAEAGPTLLEALSLSDPVPGPDGVLEQVVPETAALRLAVACAAPTAEACTASPNGAVSVDLRGVALRVEDDAHPRVAVGGLTSPVRGDLVLVVRATDEGVGLAVAEATVDGRTAASVAAGGPSCRDLDPATPVFDLPLGALCAASAQELVLRVPAAALPDGARRVVVTVRDAAGNTTVGEDREVLVEHTPPMHSAKATVAVGSGQAGAPGGAGGPAGASGPSSAAACVRPRLSMTLADRPLRTSRGRLVVRAHRRYRFDGRLTCVVAGRRRAAPVGTLVEHVHVVGRRTSRKNGVVTRRAGRLTIITSARSSRTVVFRHRSSGAAGTEVRFRLLASRGARR